LDKPVSKQRLFQNRNADLCRTPAESKARMARYQDRWQHDIAAPELDQELKAGHAWHVVVDQQATHFWQIGLVQERLGTAVKPDLETLQFQREFKRIENGHVIVNRQQDGDGLGQQFSISGSFHTISTG
jgi:hypothetical protein